MRKLNLLVIVFLFFNLVSGAQQWVTFRIQKLPSYHQKNSAVFLTGSFNNWNPGHKGSVFDVDDKGIYSMTISLPKGKHEYKITRGSWETVESGENGTQTANRAVMIKSDTTLNIEVKHWADHFPKLEKVSTAGKNVHIIDTAFYIPQLNRYRRVWIYLPEAYTTSRKKYPVLYMHDGQNVFDDATSFSGEWGVDEALDTLGRQTTESIVVAIDNGGTTRMNEYSPYDMERYGKGEGDLYVDFIVRTLKPYINKHYRTKKCRRHTFIAGSSMGGLISLYAILKYPREFGGAGVFSPAFWIAPAIKDAVAQYGRKVKGKIYFFAGMQESETMVPDMLAIFEQMHQVSKAKMTSVIRTEGRHTEATWREEFPVFYRWLMQ